MTTIDTILVDTANYLQGLARAVDGVAYAPPVSQYPTTLDTPNCPMVVSWPADGSWYVKGGAARQELRVWSVICFIEPEAQNDIPSNAEAALLVEQRLINAFTNVANIPLADPPPYQLTIESSDTRQHTDSGIGGGLRIRGVPFMGFTIRLNVRALY